MRSQRYIPSNFTASVNENTIAFFNFVSLGYFQSKCGFFRKRMSADKLAEFLEETDASFVHFSWHLSLFSRKRTFHLTTSYYDFDDLEHFVKSVNFTMSEYEFWLFYRRHPFRMLSNPPIPSESREAKKLCWKKYGF